MKECEDQITNLKRTYNNLLNSIRELLERTKEEEKIIRKNQLDLLSGTDSIRIFFYKYSGCDQRTYFDRDTG